MDTGDTVCPTVPTATLLVDLRGEVAAGLVVDVAVADLLCGVAGREAIDVAAAAALLGDTRRPVPVPEKAADPPSEEEEDRRVEEVAEKLPPVALGEYGYSCGVWAAFWCPQTEQLVPKVTGGA